MDNLIKEVKWLDETNSIIVFESVALSGQYVSPTIEHNTTYDMFTFYFENNGVKYNWQNNILMEFRTFGIQKLDDFEKKDS